LSETLDRRLLAGKGIGAQTTTFSETSRCKAILLLDDSAQLQEISEAVPAALVDVLGRSTLQRTVDSLRAQGITDIEVLSALDKPLPAYAEADLHSVAAEQVNAPVSGMWHKAERLFAGLNVANYSAVLIIRLNVYAEVDWGRLIREHIAGNARITQAWAMQPGNVEPHAIDIFAVAPNRRNDAAQLFRSGLATSRHPISTYSCGENEYMRGVRSSRDLRKLAEDMLYRRCQGVPQGTEVRPGIFIGASTRIDKGVRLVAPVYVGRRCRVRTGAVLTRGTAVEEHCRIDCGSILESATVLPYSEIGPGLDVSHSVAGHKKLFHLGRSVSTELLDPQLFREITFNAGLRTLAGVATLASFLPQQIWRGLTGNRDGNVTNITQGRACEESGSFRHATNQEAELPQLAAELAVARRYGNQ
jgi:hypothetical protein